MVNLPHIYQPQLIIVTLYNQESLGWSLANQQLVDRSSCGHHWGFSSQRAGGLWPQCLGWNAIHLCGQRRGLPLRAFLRFIEISLIGNQETDNHSEQDWCLHVFTANICEFSTAHWLNQQFVQPWIRWFWWFPNISKIAILVISRIASLPNCG